MKENYFVSNNKTLIIKISFKEIQPKDLSKIFQQQSHLSPEKTKH